MTGHGEVGSRGQEDPWDDLGGRSDSTVRLDGVIHESMTAGGAGVGSREVRT